MRTEVGTLTLGTLGEVGCIIIDGSFVGLRPASDQPAVQPATPNSY